MRWDLTSTYGFLITTTHHDTEHFHHSTMSPLCTKGHKGTSELILFPPSQPLVCFHPYSFNVARHSCKESYSRFCSTAPHSRSAHWGASLTFCTLVSSSYMTLYKGKISLKSTSCECANLLKHITNVDSILSSMWYKLRCSYHLDKPHSTSGHEMFNLLQHWPDSGL